MKEKYEKWWCKWCHKRMQDTKFLEMPKRIIFKLLKNNRNDLQIFRYLLYFSKIFAFLRLLDRSLQFNLNTLSESVFLDFQKPMLLLKYHNRKGEICIPQFTTQCYLIGTISWTATLNASWHSGTTQSLACSNGLTEVSLLLSSIFTLLHDFFRISESEKSSATSKGCHNKPSLKSFL